MQHYNIYSIYIVNCVIAEVSSFHPVIALIASYPGESMAMQCAVLTLIAYISAIAMLS